MSRGGRGRLGRGSGGRVWRGMGWSIMSWVDVINKSRWVTKGRVSAHVVCDLS